MKRRTVLTGLAAAAVPAVLGGRALAAPAAGGPLTFDRDAYTALTTTVDGRDVRYHFYRAVPYVTAPVDVRYQSLTVSVPVEIDGRAVDATQAPILLSNAAADYLPSSVADDTGVGSGAPQEPPPDGEEAPPAPAASNAELALAAGYVVVQAGVRGRSLVDDDGSYYGTAPAAIVDLKAAVRYLRFNKGVVPGDTDRIVSTGVSAGGALSALLAASGDSPLYDGYLRKLGAAAAGDAVFAGAAYSPVTDLEHADMAYEWNWGDNTLDTGVQVDQEVSQDLRMDFAEYQAGLRLQGRDDFGPLTASTYDDYLLREYLRPAATAYVAGLEEQARADYLDANPGVAWSGTRASFGWPAYLEHVGTRAKTTPAFDAFDLSAAENNLFGTGATEARHFTRYSLRKGTGNDYARLDADIDGKLALMNPMPFLTGRNPGRAKHWWLRTGTKDTGTSLTVLANLAAAADNQGDDVDAAMYWDAGSGANEDGAAFIAWIGRITGRAPVERPEPSSPPDAGEPDPDEG